MRKTVLGLFLALACVGFLSAQVGTEWVWRQVSTGPQHTVGIRTDGTLWAWGNNEHGRLGDGTAGQNNNRFVPIQIGADSNWAYVSAGVAHTMAIRADGTLWAWGSNSSGQLGDPRYHNTLIPIRIGTDTNWASVSAGQAFTVGMRTDGTLWAWGAGGLVGDGTSTNRSSPVRIGTVWTYVSAGPSHTMAISRDGSLWAWGNNGQGRLGDGTTTNRTAPVRIGTDTNWASVSAGTSHTVAVRTDGTLWAWGNNGSGRLGDGTTTNRTYPVQIGPLPVWAFAVAGDNHTAAVRTNGTLWAWGNNTNGRLGDGTTTNRNTPVQVGTDINWASISLGGHSWNPSLAPGGHRIDGHTVAVRTDGTLWAWGHNGSGRLGDGTATNRNTPTRVGTGPALVAATVSAGVNHTMAVGTDGSLWAWGLNRSGQLGHLHGDSPIPVRIGTATNWAYVSTGVAHTVAIRMDGTLWAWGANGYGQLGTVTVPPVDHWGRVGANIHATPLQIGTATNWAYVSAGHSHTLGLRTDGTLWAWGHNGAGQLGDGTRTNRNTPVQIGTDTNWAYVSAGVVHTVAIRTDGTLWAWGYNGNDFRLGTAWEDTFSAIPVQVGTDSNWASAYAGYRHSVAIRTNGALYAWGFNQSGQLGDGSTSVRFSPTRIGTDYNWASVSVGEAHTVGIRTDGSVWAWGNNGNGRLGDGTTASHNTPVRIQMPTGWLAASVSASGSHTMAVGRNGLVFAWGANGIAADMRWSRPAVIGSLGTGHSAGWNHTTPTQVRQ